MLIFQSISEFELSGNQVIGPQLMVKFYLLVGYLFKERGLFLTIKFLPIKMLWFLKDIRVYILLTH